MNVKWENAQSLIDEYEKVFQSLNNAIEHKGLMEVREIERNIEFHLSIAKSTIKEQETFNGNNK